MTFTKTLFAAAAGAALLTGVLANVASAQDMRYGEFRRFEEKHRFGERCRSRAEARGFAERKFFGGAPGGRAEQRAIRHWEEQVSRADGPQYASWARAEGKQAGCKPKGPLEIECVVSAHPCRPR